MKKKLKIEKRNYLSPSSLLCTEYFLDETNAIITTFKCRMIEVLNDIFRVLSKREFGFSRFLAENENV